MDLKRWGQGRLLIVLTGLFACLVFASPAYAGQCDGTVGPDVVTCAANPTVPDGEVGLDSGDDTYVQNQGVTSAVVSGDSLDDGTQNPGNGGDDHITINGIVGLHVDGDTVNGDGGNDTIVINGEIQSEVTGDFANGNGGDDHITINGTVASDVVGDTVGLVGGNDTIIINGYVGGDVVGDESTDGGNDSITINGTVAGDVLGDDASGIGGNDTVSLGANANVGGTIDGEGGFDSLVFKFLRQSQVDSLGLNSAAGSLTYNGHTFTWLNFEALYGALSERLRLLFLGDELAAFDALDGVRVFHRDRLIAFISYAALANLDPGIVRQFQAVNSGGWYVTVSRVGSVSDQPKETYLTTIYSPAGVASAQFTFSN